MAKGFFANLFQKIADREKLIADSFYVDSGVKFEDKEEGTLEDELLDHLIGKKVSILADGSVLPNQDVIEGIDGHGSIKLDRGYGKIIVGLLYESNYASLKMEKSQHNASGGKNKLVSRVLLYLLNSRGLEISVDGVRWKEFKERSDEPYGELTRSMNGYHELTVSDDSGAEKSLHIRSILPLNTTVISAECEVNFGSD
jgi:hypothetical protein